MFLIYICFRVDQGEVKVRVSFMTPNPHTHGEEPIKVNNAETCPGVYERIWYFDAIFCQESSNTKQI